MFALQISTPIHWVFKGMPALFKYLDGLDIMQSFEWLIHYKTKTGKQFIIVHLCKEFQIIHTMGHGIIDEVFQEVLGKIHVIIQVIESHFWLNHPELGKMSSG